MAAGPLPPMDFLRHLRAAVSGSAPAVSDAELIDRFSRDRDEAAFELLVWRHGRLVWGVCRRVARDRHAAEDAFQATFLALARHAGSVANRSAVAGWLYRVAYRAGLEAKRCCRRQAEPISDAVASDQSSSPPDEAARRELWRVIDAEVSTMSEPFRAAFVLCEIQGLSNAQAAVALGCPVGTVESRLSRARAKLARRLSARGVTASGGFAGLTAMTVPGNVLATAMRAGVEGSAGVSSGVAALAARAGRASAWPRVVTGLIVAVTAAAAVGLSAAQNPGADSPDTPTARKTTNDQPAIDPLPDGAIARIGSARFRAPYGAWSPTFALDGKSLAVAGRTSVRVFDVATGLPRFTVATADDNTNSLIPAIQFTTNGELVISTHEYGKSDYFVRRFDLSGRPANQLKINAPHGLTLWSSTLSGDGTRTAAVWLGAKVVLHVYDARTGAALCTVPLDQSPSNSQHPVLSLDGRVVAVETAGIVRVFDTDMGTELGRWDYPGSHPLQIVITPGGKQVFTFRHGTENAIKVRDLATGRTVDELSVQYLWWLTVCPTGDLLAYGTDGEVTVWDWKKRAVRHRLAKGTTSRTAAFSPDGKVIMTGDYCGAITLWDVETGKRLPVSADPPTGVRELRFLDGGKRLAGLTDSWMTWDAKTRAPGPRLSLPAWYRQVTDLSPDGRLVATCPGGKIVVSDTRTGIEAWTVPTQDQPVFALRFTPDGRQLLARHGELLEARNTTTGRVEASVAIENGSGLVAVSPDGRRAVVTGTTPIAFDSPVIAYDLTTRQRLWADYEYQVPDSTKAAAYSPDGRLFAYVSPVRVPLDGGGTWRLTASRLIVRDARTGRLITKVDDIGSPGAECLSFSPDGQFLALGGYSQSAEIWDVASGKRVWRFHHGSIVDALAFSPDEMTLAAASADAPVYLWDVFGTRTRTGPPPDRTALQKAVAELADTDPAAAFRAARTLHAAPDGAVAAIRDGVNPVAVPDPASVRRLIAELDSPDFRTREAAERTLTDHAPHIKRAVKGALDAA
ncbi:MAG TPA: sigma-70 family RNA polymerase sigma factor, partial [Fimbriiglobus sp.]|nr:sigma-70 family RNA polymerase sigma factor [Fimbriiglobus sp.]